MIVAASRGGSRQSLFNKREPPAKTTARCLGEKIAKASPANNILLLKPNQSGSVGCGVSNMCWISNKIGRILIKTKKKSLAEAWVYPRRGRHIVRGNPSVRLIHGSKTNSEIRRVSVNTRAHAHTRLRLASGCTKDSCRVWIFFYTQP